MDIFGVAKKVGRLGKSMVEKMAAKMDNAMDDQQVVESADYLVGW